MRGRRGVRGLQLLWLTYLILGVLACCGVPERASQAFAEEGDAAGAVVAADTAQPAPTEPDTSPTEGPGDATERDGGSTDASVGSPEATPTPTEDTGPSEAEAREVVLTSEGTTLHAIRQVVAFAQRRPLLAACVSGASAITLIATSFALARYHSRPYAQRRRRRHYVA